MALAAGHAQEAVDAAEPAKPYDANYPASYVQGLAYLQLHDAGHALNAFQAAIRSNSGTLQFAFAPFRAQVQLGLARAYAMGGDKADAKKAYESLFPNLEKRRRRPAHAGSRKEGIRRALVGAS